MDLVVQAHPGKLRKDLKKTDSEGISDRLAYPQMRHNPREVRKASRVEQVKGWL